jgi:predicted ATPase/class 3 adenylate cyclase
VADDQSNPRPESETVQVGRSTDPPRPQPPNAGQSPQTLGRYVIERSLGTGGYGQVFLAQDRELRRPVAVKVLNAGARATEVDVERFQAEARRLAQLRHPGIVTVHDVGVQDGLIYVVSDYLEGPNLHQWLRGSRPDWRETVRVVAEIAGALAYAHTRATIHRDVKPENVIMAGGRSPVLIDFGLGLDETVSGGELGLISGTYQYMAPEQALGLAHRIDGRTDIYGLGVVLYQLLCGRVPFRSFDRRELVRQIQQDEPQPLRQLVPAIPSELDRICLKALSKRAQDRHTTASDLADDLRRLLHDSQQSGSVPLSGPAVAGSPQPAFDPSAALDATSETAPRTQVRATSSGRRAAAGAERRQVTMLACSAEVFDAAAFFALDPEDQARLRAAFDHVCEEIVESFGGTITQRSYRGLVACYGYPVAHEDAARRAAGAGLTLLEQLTPGRHPQIGDGLDLTPWIGLHTGTAIGEVRPGGVSVAGDAPNVAARFESIAERGMVLCTGSTYSLIRDYFQCESAGTREIRGVLPGSETYRVVEALEGTSRLERTQPDRLTPLIGRDNEVSLLVSRWERATEGMGQVVQIMGEAGLGKSRLVYTLKQHLRAQASAPGAGAATPGRHPAPSSEETAAEWAIVEWRCSPQRQNSSLYPVIEFFERLADTLHIESPEGRFDRLVTHLEGLGLANDETVPLFASLLSLPLGPGYKPITLSPAREREATLTAIRDWLRAYAARRTVLFIVEDLQWIDASTLEFLQQFVLASQRDSILTLLTFRPDFKTPWPVSANQTTLALTPLTRKEVTVMLQRRIESTLPPTMIDQLHDRTGGVPLFVEEFAQLVRESGALERVGTDTGRIRVLFAREIPSTLQDLVMARLGRVEGGLELAQLAATIGREFSHELLAAVSGKDEATLEVELAQLIDAEILFQKGRPPRCTYIFKHALLEDAAYNSMVKTTRQKHHRRIAETLEERFGHTAETEPELLAHHFGEAGLTTRSVEFWLKSGLRARHRSADIETIADLTRGLALLETLEPSVDRDRLELQFLGPLVTAYIAVRGYPSDEIGPVLDRSRVLCERVGDRNQLFVLAWGTWIWHIVRGEFRVAVDLAAETMKIAETLEDPSGAAEALFPVGATRLYRGDFTGARAAFERGLSDYDDPERAQAWSALTGHDARITFRCNLALALWYLGCPEQALNRIREAREIAESLRQPFHMGYVLHHAGWLNHHCRLAAEAEAAGDGEIDIALEQGSRSWHATGRMYKAAGMLLDGRVEGVPLFLDGLEAYRATGHGLALPYYLSILGSVHTRMGRFQEALDTLDEGLRTVEANDDRFQEAELHRLKGEALLASSADTTVEAEACFNQALAIARRQQSKAWELRAAMSLARVWQRTGRTGDARTLLGYVYSSFTEGHHLPDLTEANALIAALREPPPVLT